MDPSIHVHVWRFDNVVSWRKKKAFWQQCQCKWQWLMRQFVVNTSKSEISMHLPPCDIFAEGRFSVRVLFTGLISNSNYWPASGQFVFTWQVCSTQKPNNMHCCGHLWIHDTHEMRHGLTRREPLPWWRVKTRFPCVGQSTVDAHANTSKWNLLMWMGVFTLDASHIKGFVRKFACSHPVSWRDVVGSTLASALVGVNLCSELQNWPRKTTLSLPIVLESNDKPVGRSARSHSNGCPALLA